jgi:electron transfer flavoprotein beta subunit
MHVAVFLKYVIDPDFLSRDFSLDANGLPTTTFPSFQFDQYDRIALEIALKLRDQTADVKVTSVCAGRDGAEDRLRDALAVKVSEAVLIAADRSMSDHDRGGLMAAWVKRQSGLSVVLCGRMTSDTDSSETGPVIAETLGWPMISNVVKIEHRDGRIVCKREVGDGYEWVYADGPFVATATNAPDTTLRKAKLQDVMRTQKMPIVRLDAGELMDAGTSHRGLTTLRNYIPGTTHSCQWIDGDSPEDKARELADRLRTVLGRKASVAAS